MTDDRPGVRDTLPITLPEPPHIHVWRLAISAIRAGDMHSLLAEDERSRAARFVFDKDREQFVVVRGWLRRLCGAYLNCAPTAVRFAYGLAGKPALAADTGTALCFNVSHSHEYALLAFSRGHDVGVDVERMEDRIDLSDLARSCFSPAELHAFQECAPHERLETFFRYWTSKEAYIKALGDGLSMPLQDFTVDAQPGTTVWSVHTSRGPASPVVIYPLAVREGYAAALAAIGTGVRIVVRDLS